MTEPEIYKEMVTANHAAVADMQKILQGHPLIQVAGMQQPADDLLEIATKAILFSALTCLTVQRDMDAGIRGYAVGAAIDSAERFLALVKGLRGISPEPSMKRGPAN